MDEILKLLPHERLIRNLPNVDTGELRRNSRMQASLIAAAIAEARMFAPADQAKLMEAIRVGENGHEHLLGSLMAHAIPGVSLFAAGFRHWNHGGATYVVGPRLSEMFARTSLEHVEWSDLRLPFPIIFVALPDTEYKLWGGQQFHPVGGAFLSTCTAVKKDGTEVEALHLLVSCLDAETWGDDVVFQTVIPADSRLEEELRWEDVKDEFGGAPDLEDERATLRCVSRVVINLLLYLQAGLPTEETAESAARRSQREDLHKQAARRKGSKAARALRRADALSTVSVIWLGREVEGTGDGGGTHASPRRHWVRGHWHPYWHGPGKTLRKLNWVKPFLRGDPQRGEVESRIYMPEGQE